MPVPEIFVAYAPRGAGLRCALAYLEDARDVYGWFAGPRHDTSVAACYFVLDDFRAAVRVRYCEFAESALQSLAEPRRRELAAMQETFAREWLFYRNEARAYGELLAYCDAELAAGEVNLRFEKLAALSKRQPNWTYSSPQFDRRVLRSVARYWPLEYRPHVADVLPRPLAGATP